MTELISDKVYPRLLKLLSSVAVISLPVKVPLDISLGKDGEKLILVKNKQNKTHKVETNEWEMCITKNQIW